MQEEMVEVQDNDFDLGEETREVSTAELDAAVKTLVDARLEYDSKKRLATEANTAVELAETK